MDLFGVGPLEVLLVILLALVLFGPKDIAKNARTAGRFLNRIYKSEGWRTMVQASSTLRNLPNRLAREAELEELEEVRRELAQPGRPPEVPSEPAVPGMAAWTPSPAPPPPPAAPPSPDAPA